MNDDLLVLNAGVLHQGLLIQLLTERSEHPSDAMGVTRSRLQYLRHVELITSAELKLLVEIAQLICDDRTELPALTEHVRATAANWNEANSLVVRALVAIVEHRLQLEQELLDGAFDGDAERAACGVHCTSTSEPFRGVLAVAYASAIAGACSSPEKNQRSAVIAAIVGATIGCLNSFRCELEIGDDIG